MSASRAFYTSGQLLNTASKPGPLSPFALDVIRPLLEMKPCEVLVNFMTQHIVRFINNRASRQSFERLFGSSTFRERLAGTRKEDRVDAAVFEYRDAVSSAGRFTHPGIAGILNPLKNRSNFHLIYLSRNPKGLEVFKDAEKRSMPEMETVRANAERKARELKTRRREFVWSGATPESDYFQSLRERYQSLAQKDLESALRRVQELPYDDAWTSWLRYPMVWESDLKLWIKSSGIRIKGLSMNERVPKRGRGHVLVATEPA